MFRTVPFPSLPAWLPIELEQRPVTLRSFGDDMRDLAVEFEQAERARLVTSLLTRCSMTSAGHAASEATIWNLPIGTRVEAVLRLATGVSDRPLEWRVRCGYADCGAEGELELHADELTDFAERAYREELVPVKVGQRTATLRRPTGADQLRWLEDVPCEAVAMAAALFIDPALKELHSEGLDMEKIGDAIDIAMEQYDPLVGFNVDVGCHECGRTTRQAPDLVAAALERLWGRQFRLIDQVHLLASCYHWTEEEIARLPAWRRQAYLARIDGGQS